METKILGLGSYLPEQIVTNDELSGFFNRFVPENLPLALRMNPRWIGRRLGINQRRLSCSLAGTGNGIEHDTTLAEYAADLALEDSGVGSNEISALLHATATPERYAPDPTCKLADSIWAGGASFGIVAGCAGFIYQLIVADALIQSGKAQYVLVTGSNCISPYFQTLSHLGGMDAEHIKNDRLAASLFGDGAGAVVLGPVGTVGTIRGTRKKVIVETFWGAWGDGNPPVWIEAGGSSMPTTEKTVREGRHCFRMNMSPVLDRGVSLLAWAVTQLLRKVGKSVEDIKYFVFHQASQPFLQAVIRELNIPRHSVPINCDRYGNTVNATLPITLHELAKSGDLHRGDLIVLAAVGDGWQYGSALVEW